VVVGLEQNHGDGRRLDDLRGCPERVEVGHAVGNAALRRAALPVVRAPFIEERVKKALA